MLLRNPLYGGLVDVPEYGVRNRRGNFGPLVPKIDLRICDGGAPFTRSSLASEQA
jgi:hypothetical protein